MIYEVDGITYMTVEGKTLTDASGVVQRANPALAFVTSCGPPIR